ncbi:hypothetical protein SOPP22_07765 [Shewanella sp. OPT22]|nr:hypothetical protein SOPP22_07765 [Shewanella sp. OPT22]
MKKIIIIVSSIAMLLALLKHLATDDQLLPEARHLISKNAKQPNLENNAYISLMALGEPSSNSYELSLIKYRNSVKAFRQNAINFGEIMMYPQLDKFTIYQESSNFCPLDEKGCINQLLKNKNVIEAELKHIDSIILDFIKISKLENFDELNSLSTAPDFEVLMSLFRLTGIKILFLIDDGQYDKAAVLLSELVTLDRRFSKTNSEVAFFVLPMINYQTIYTPLIQELIKSDFTEWGVIKPAITPLSIAEISMNSIWIKRLIEGATVFKFAHIAETSLKQINPLNKLQARIKYKENMTINKMFGITKAQLIPESVSKKNLVFEYLSAKERGQKEHKKLKEELEHPLWSSIKNYRNVVGNFMVITSGPGLLNFYQDKIETDLRILLLNALVMSIDSPIEQVISDPKLINPYNGEIPFIRAQSICYKHLKDICLPFTPNQ